MANDTYTANADGSCYVGMFSRPSWVISQAINAWGTVPLTTSWNDLDPQDDPLVNPNFPSDAPWRGITGFKGRFIAWCGQTAHGGVIYDGSAGGHGDYAGNETFKLDLNSESPSVVRMTNPSGAVGNEIVLDDGQESTGLYSDGQPRSPHSYNSPVFFPPTNKFLLAVLGNGLYKSGQAGTGSAAVFNAGTMSFEGLTSPAPAGTGTRSPMGSCYDSNRELIWYRGAGTARFATLNPVTDEWVNRGSQTALSGGLGFCYIPEHDVIFIINFQYANKFAIFDCSTYQYYEPSLTGALLGAVLNGGMQPHYIGDGQIAVWDNTDNTESINILSFSGDPRTSEFSAAQLPVAGENEITPTVKTPNGTYGRFQWHKNLGIFTTINGIEQPMYFYRMR